MKDPATSPGDDSPPASLGEQAVVDAVAPDAGAGEPKSRQVPPVPRSGGNAVPSDAIPAGGHRAPGPPDTDEDVEEPDDAPSEGAMSDRTRSLLEWVVVIAGALVVALLIKTFLFQAFYIPSESMDPTLAVGDRVLVNKLSYDVHDVNRGDLIVFKKPAAEGEGGVQDLIKRVIGLPGETVTARDNVVYIDGKPLEEPYLDDDVFTDQYEGEPIPEGHVFVMGDNRTDSRDSRFFGPIPESDIVGRAFFRVWPPSDISFL